MNQSPIGKVRAQYGSKEELAKKVQGFLSPKAGETEESFARRIRTASNTKLLRLAATEEKVRTSFGSKEKLADAIVALKFGGNANADYRAKLLTYANTRLLDLHTSLSRKAASA